MVGIKIFRSKKIKILVAIIVIVGLCCGAIWYMHSQRSKTYGVPLVINAEGMDTDKGTKIPIHAKGEDVWGDSFDESFYGETASSDIVLKPGKYTLSVSDSPIAEDGTIYSVDGANTDVSISKDGKVSVGSEITILPISAEKVTDEEIEKAWNVAEDSGIDASKLNALKEKARERRDTAVAQKKAAEKKAAEEKAAAEQKVAEEKVAESSDGHSYSNEYFYIDVPADWKSSEWSVEQISATGWEFSHMPVDDYGGGVRIIVADDNPWPDSNAIKNLGKLADGQNVYASEAGAGFLDYVTFGLNSQWTYDHEYAQEHGLTDEGETDWNAIWEAREKMKEEETGGN